MKKIKIICGLILGLVILGTTIVVCEDSASNWLITLTGNSTSKNATYTNRIILLSDIHYEAAGEMFGYTQNERMQMILDDVNKFMETETVETVLTLGDLSTDDYGYRNLAENYVIKYKQEVMNQFLCDTYVLPGNHDSYPNAKWNEIFGNNRQYSVKIGDAAFIMLDTFNDVPTDSPNGSDYTGIDVEWLKQEIEKYPTEQIFICAHYFDMKQSDSEFNKLLSENERIVCMINGHSHENKVLMEERMGDRYIIDVGGYACMDSKEYDDACAWGFGVLEWNDTEAHYYHVKYSHTYIGSNGTFDFDGAIEDEIIIKFK